MSTFGYLNKESGTLHYEYRVPSEFFRALHEVEQQGDPQASLHDAICYPTTSDFFEVVRSIRDLKNPSYSALLDKLEAAHAQDREFFRKRNEKKLRQARARGDFMFAANAFKMPVCIIPDDAPRKTLGERLMDLDLQQHERFHAWSVGENLEGEYAPLTGALHDYVFDRATPLMTDAEFDKMMEKAEGYGADEIIVEEIFARISGARYAVEQGIKKKWFDEANRFDALYDLAGMQWGVGLATLAEAIAKSGEPTAAVYKRLVQQAAP